MKYSVECYDKDGDHYDVMTEVVSLTLARRIADSLADLVKKGNLVRRDNKEPYDWVSVFDASDNQVYVASTY